MFNNSNNINDIKNKENKNKIISYKTKKMNIEIQIKRKNKI